MRWIKRSRDTRDGRIGWVHNYRGNTYSSIETWNVWIGWPNDGGSWISWCSSNSSGSDGDGILNGRVGSWESWCSWCSWRSWCSDGISSWWKSILSWSSCYLVDSIDWIGGWWKVRIRAGESTNWWNSGRLSLTSSGCSLIAGLALVVHNGEAWVASTAISIPVTVGNSVTLTGTSLGSGSLRLWLSCLVRALTGGISVAGETSTRSSIPIAVGKSCTAGGSTCSWIGCWANRISSRWESILSASVCGG